MFLTLMFACTGDATDTADERISSAGGCEDTPSALALDELSPLGLTADELLAAAGGETVEELLWADDGAAALTLTLTYTGGEVAWVDSEYVPPEGDGSYTLAMPVCEDRLEVPLALSFTTDDGAFDEAGTVTLSYGEEGDTADFWMELIPGELGGTFTPSGYAPEGYEDEARLWISGGFTLDGASSGAIAGQVSGEDGDTAWAESFEVATWPAADSF